MSQTKPAIRMRYIVLITLFRFLQFAGALVLLTTFGVRMLGIDLWLLGTPDPLKGWAVWLLAASLLGEWTANRMEETRKIGSRRADRS